MCVPGPGPLAEFESTGSRTAINALMEMFWLASDSRPAIEARRGDPVLGELVERALACIPEASRRPARGE
ncbi:MAG: hypothetical protein SGI90_05085 [Candidatus Eisenbacteria bacterium]|nr:hypothetical protein [Candidatus Eisenbacteria bacterium]